jgi:hypothetical protein
MAEVSLKRLMIVPGILLVIGLAGFIGFEIWRSSFSAPIPVALSPVSSASGWQVTVTGTTDLPDGALLLVEVDGTTGKQQSIATVAGGAFSTKFDASNVGEGPASVTTSFSIVYGPAQPQAVVDRFGPEGQRIGGAQIYRAAVTAPRALRVTQSVTLPGPGSA